MENMVCVDGRQGWDISLVARSDDWHGCRDILVGFAACALTVVWASVLALNLRSVLGRSTSEG
jgi:hypothetical protein